MNNELYKLSNSNINMLDIIFNARADDLAIMIKKDIEKVKAFIAAPKELGKPWYGQLMAGPQLMAYYIQLNYWMKQYRLELP